jgi:hypothetical protein
MEGEVPVTELGRRQDYRRLYSWNDLGEFHRQKPNIPQLFPDGKELVFSTMEMPAKAAVPIWLELKTS